MPRGQQKRSETTRTTLLDVARPLFAERGYARVSADELVAAAGLTRGALHHQFGDKKGLFREVLLQVEQELADQVAAAMAPHDTVQEKMVVALDAFLNTCTDPAVSRIALLDAPAVLGWAQWRQIEADHGLRLITDLLRQGMATGAITAQPVDVLARLILSALIESALMVSHAEDRAAARTEAQQALGGLLSGLLATA